MIQLTILTSVSRTEQHSIASSRLEDRAGMSLISPVSGYGPVIAVAELRCRYTVHTRDQILDRGHK